MGYKVEHKLEARMNKEKFKMYLERKDMNAKQLWEKIVDEYGIHIKYRGFIALINKQNLWKLTYAYVICEALEIDIKDIFELKPTAEEGEE